MYVYTFCFLMRKLKHLYLQYLHSNFVHCWSSMKFLGARCCFGTWGQGQGGWCRCARTTREPAAWWSGGWRRSKLWWAPQIHVFFFRRNFWAIWQLKRTTAEEKKGLCLFCTAAGGRHGLSKWKKTLVIDDGSSHIALTMPPREAIAHVLQAAGVMATTTMLPVAPWRCNP